MSVQNKKHRPECLHPLAAMACLFMLFVLPPSVLADMPEDDIQVHGYVSTKYVTRSTQFSGNNYSDQDFYESVRYDSASSLPRSFEVHVYGTSRQDIDGGRDSEGYDPLEDIGDARDIGYAGNVYDAHLALNQPVRHIQQVRLGRQSGTRDEPVFFDGLAADMKFGAHVFTTVYGGAAVRFEELEYDWGDDSLAGLGLDVVTDFRTIVSLDYLYEHDERGQFNFEDKDDHLYSLKIVQRLPGYVWAMARMRYLDDEERDLKLRAAWTLPESGMELSAGYLRQFGTEQERSNDLSVYYDVVGETFEYESYDLRLRKLFGDHYAVDLGYYTRALTGEEDETSFNRDYSRLYAALDLIEVFMEHLTVTLSGASWKADDSSFLSAGLDASYEFRKRGNHARLEAGTYYSLYKYDYYVQRGERDNVQTYYARAIMPVGRSLSADGKYEFENGAEDYHQLSLGVRYDF